MHKLFKRVAVVVLCILSFSFVNACQADPRFVDTNNNVVQLSKLRGNWVIVNYWAAWCTGCVHEIPELNSFYRNVQGKNVVLYGVNFDQLPVTQLKSAMNSVDIKFPVIVGDPNEAWQLGDISVIPATFIINPKGKVVKRIYGTNTEASLTAILQSLQQKG